MGRFHYVDAKGQPKHEDLDADQSTTDVNMVREFEALEGELSKGRDVKAEAYRGARETLLANATTLPPARAAHWQREFERIGIAAAPVEKPKTEKVEKK